MPGFASSTCAMMVAIIFVAPTASAQVTAEGTSSLSFRPADITITAGQDLTADMLVEAEIQCSPSFGAPDGPLQIWGTDGIAWASGAGDYYRTSVEEENVWLEAVGNNKYRAEAVIPLAIRADVSVDESTTKVVHYGVNSASGQACAAGGWKFGVSEMGELALSLEPAVSSGSKDTPPLPAFAGVATLGLLAAIAGRRSG